MEKINRLKDHALNLAGSHSGRNLSRVKRFDDQFNH